MNKHFTLLAAALMVAGALSAETLTTEQLGSTDNFYYMKTAEGAYLSLCGSKPDSVIVKAIDESALTKAQIDSALWQIVDKKITDGVTTYQIRNKATLSYLSFAPQDEPVPNLDFTAEGINRWRIENDVLMGYYPGTTDYLTLKVEGDDLSVVKANTEDGTAFSWVVPAEKFILNAEQLGNGFQTFQLNFKDRYDGDIFSGKDLIANDIQDKDGYVTLQVKGDESYPDNAVKYLGLDTMKTEIAGASDVFGYKFSLDSTREVLKPNATWQQFQFTVDLKSDSVAMFIAGNPLDANMVQVVIAKVDTKQVLTVSKVGEDGKVAQGAAPHISLSAGTPVTIPTGDGVYFLKSASKDEDGGKYYVANKSFMGKDSVPSVNLPRGQWLVKANGGKYTIVDRESNSPLIQDKEIFEVQGMEDTYLIGGDSITVEQHAVDLNNKYLGSFVATEQDLVNKGYYLSLFTGTPGVPELFMYADDSVLKGSAVDMQLFKLFPSDTNVVAGAKLLGDEISVISYQLGGYFMDGKVAKDGDKGLKFSTTDPLSFRFLSDANGQFYSMATDADNKYVGIDVNTSNLQLTSTKTIVNIAPVDAPEYATFEAGHKRLVSDGNSLVMNPLNLFAQMKTEGSEITKATYEKDNFSLWIEPDTMVAGKQLYLISSGSETGTRCYMSVKDTSFTGIDYDKYAMFVEDNDTIKTMKDSPALFAFKVNEHGGYLLENYKELKNGGKPYVGIVNGFVVLEKFPHVAFEVEAASAPTPNEEINVSEIKVISSDGQVIVTNASGKKITLSNILGQTIGVRRASSEYFSMPATSGIVLVTVEGDTTYKVIVK